MSQQSVQSPEQDQFSSLENWVAAERANGLVDMKFAVSEGPIANASNRIVIAEFLQSEKKIAAGIVLPPLTEGDGS